MKNLILILVATALVFSSCKKDGGGTQAPNTPSAPGNVTASPDDGKDSISFSQVLDANPIISYNIYGGNVAGYNGKLIGVVKSNGTSTATYSFIHTGLTNGTTWYYYVTAATANGEGAKSAEVSATPSVPISKTATMLIQRYLPAVVQAAPMRYYDQSNSEYGNIPAAKTDTFKLYVSSNVIAGHDISIFSQDGVNRGKLRSSDVLLATYPEKNYVYKAGINKSGHKQVEQWQWRGIPVQFYNSPKSMAGVYDTMPVIFKVSNLKALNNFKSTVVRVTDALSWWTLDNAFGAPVNYEQTLNVSDFTVVEGWAKWDKTKNTVFHVGSDYFFVASVPCNQYSVYDFEIHVNYTDGSSIDQMMVYFYQTGIIQ